MYFKGAAKERKFWSLVRQREYMHFSNEHITFFVFSFILHTKLINIQLFLCVLLK